MQPNQHSLSSAVACMNTHVRLSRNCLLVCVTSKTSARGFCWLRKTQILGVIIHTSAFRILPFQVVLLRNRPDLVCKGLVFPGLGVSSYETMSSAGCIQWAGIYAGPANWIHNFITDKPTIKGSKIRLLPLMTANSKRNLTYYETGVVVIKK